MQSYLPSELRNVVNTQTVPAPGGIRIPFPKKRP